MKRSTFKYACFLSVSLALLFLPVCNVSAESGETIFQADFEDGMGDWSTDGGSWVVDPPLAGPKGCYDGVRCAHSGVGNPGDTVSRMISPPVDLPSIAGDGEIRLSFRHCFFYGPHFQGSGTVEISHFDSGENEWSPWKALGDSFIGRNTAWSSQEVDLSNYRDRKIRVAFKHDSGKRDDTGWYVDAVQIRKIISAPEGESDSISKPAVTSFKINGGAASTAHRRVTLNNTASGTPTQYMASESSTFSGATWKTYSRKPTFTLSAGVGVKRVYFKVRNAAGQSARVSDAITLTNPLGGTWTGRWVSDYGSSGNLKLVATQTASGYTGKLSIWNTDCGNLLDISSTLTLSGDIVTCVATTSCYGSSLKLKFTRGILSGNSIDGYYNVYENGSFYDSGDFSLKK